MTRISALWTALEGFVDVMGIPLSVYDPKIFLA